MEIAYVYNYDGKGGGSSQARTLIEQFHKHDDVEVHGVHAGELNTPEKLVTDKTGFPLVFPTSIEDTLEELNPDIVFVHGFGPDLNTRLRETKKDGDVDATWVYRYGANLYESWALLTDPKTRNSRHVLDQVWGLDWYDCIVCPSQTAAVRTKHLYGDDCPRLAHIPNGIKRSDYVPSSFMSDGELRVLSVSRAGPNDFLLSPVWAVVRLSSDNPVSMDILSAAPKAAANALASIDEAVEDVNYHGYCDHSKVKTHMELADVVCVPSVSQQAIPLAALEGMAAGNVVITGAFPTAQEEPALITAPVPHPPAWHQAIEDAIEDPEDAQKWVQKGIDNARKYDVRKIVGEKYIPIFQELLEDA